MAEVELPDQITVEEDRRRWAAEQVVKVVCAGVTERGLSDAAAIDYLLDKFADALDSYAKDGTVNRREDVSPGA